MTHYLADGVFEDLQKLKQFDILTAIENVCTSTENSKNKIIGATNWSPTIPWF